jgi:hypothetical protein
MFHPCYGGFAWSLAGKVDACSILDKGVKVQNLVPVMDTSGDVGNKETACLG